MKFVAVGLVVVLFAGNAFAQSAPAAAPAPQATQEATQQDDAQATTAKPAANGQQVPTVPVQSEKSKNTAAIILGAVGAAALIGAASSGGGDDAPANPQPQPSSP